MSQKPNTTIYFDYLFGCDQIPKRLFLFSRFHAFKRQYSTIQNIMNSSNHIYPCCKWICFQYRLIFLLPWNFCWFMRISSSHKACLFWQNTRKHTGSFFSSLLKNCFKYFPVLPAWLYGQLHFIIWIKYCFFLLMSEQQLISLPIMNYWQANHLSVGGHY